jgi:MFS transporter, DHA2 family, glioxin efflux transporter
MEESKVRMNGIEKVDDHSSESQNETTVTTTDYPTKFKLIMIVVALVLSMFLVSEIMESSLYIVGRTLTADINRHLWTW